MEKLVPEDSIAVCCVGDISKAVYCDFTVL